MRYMYIVVFLLFSLSLNAHIVAMRVPGNVSSIGPNSKAWLSSRYTDIVLYPQTSIKSSDKEANELNQNSFAKRVKVKALSDGKNISILVKWADKTENNSSINGYVDGFAIEFPLKFEDATQLPFVIRGSKQRGIVLHVKKALKEVYELDSDIYYQIDKNNQNLFGKDLEEYEKEVKKRAIKGYEKVFMQWGMRVKEIKSFKSHMQMIYKNGYWLGTLSMPLKSSYVNLDKGAFALAISIWDGEKKSRGDLKLISSWIGVKLDGSNGGEKFLKDIKIKLSGDIKNGEKLVLENCAVCHRYKGVVMAPEFMAPNLSNIGGYSTTKYIEESILKPNAVVIKGYNKTAHKNFVWYNVDNNGKITSTMPSYDWMSKKNIEDMVTFLKSLRGIE